MLALQHISKNFTISANRQIIDALTDISFDIQPNTFVSIVGPSGCGKSTLINIIGGLYEPSDGTITLHKTPIDGPDRNRGMVFQQYTSFPWLTVQRNVEFGLKLLGVDAAKRSRVAQQYIRTVGLAGFEQAYPQQLSGGMQQRVALARTLATDPEILLMDEPFSSLDTQTRRFMQDLLLQVWQKTKKTILFVTHDVDEAIIMSDRVYVMSAAPGTIKETITIDLPRPRTLEVEFSENYVLLKKKIQTMISEESLKTLNEPIADMIKEVYK